MQPGPSPIVLSSRLTQHIWRAPLVPIALALTLGILLDRYLAIPPLVSFGASSAALVAWTANLRATSRGLFYLWGACVGLGAAHHQMARDGIADNDIRNLAAIEPK